MTEATRFILKDSVSDDIIDRAHVAEDQLLFVAKQVATFMRDGSHSGVKWDYPLDGVEMFTLLRVLTSARRIEHVKDGCSVVGRHVIVAKHDSANTYKLTRRVVVSVSDDNVITVGASQRMKLANPQSLKTGVWESACYIDHTGSSVTAGKTTKIEDDPLPWEKEGDVKKLSELMSSKGGADEYYTPDYVVEEILRFIPKGAIVWCPFDKEDSAFVRLIGKTHEVVFGHIDNGNDYYDYEPDKWDMMISNPPFTAKRKIFERALGFGKPFCLLMTASWLNDAAPKQIWPEAEKDLQLMMFRNRVHFIKPDGSIEKKTNFSSAFFCADFLPKQIIISGK